MIRCEVCDDTNATIHCQECRRNTCEECDEILHLVEANKSHHRIPLFSSRNGSRKGSYAPTRAVSPRGTKKAEDIIPEYPSRTQNDGLNGVPARNINTENLNFGNILRPVTEENAQTSDKSQTFLPASNPLNANGSLYQASKPSTSSGSDRRTYSGGMMSDQNREPQLVDRDRERAQPPPPPPAQYQVQTQSVNAVTNFRPAIQAEYENNAALSQTATGTDSFGASKPNVKQPTPNAPFVHPTYRVNQMEPLARSNLPQQTGNASGQQPTRMVNQSNPLQQQAPNAFQTKDQFQPLLPYQQPGRVPISSVLHGQSRSGTTTPAVAARNQVVGARSVPHSGHATPTYNSNVAHRFSATGGAIPLNQWNEPSQSRAQEVNRPLQMREREPPPAVKQQALAQHMQVIEQHRAVEAHQRMMAQKQQQQQHQHNQARVRQAQTPQQAGIRMHPQQQQPYGYVFSSVPTSLAPSARNSPPMYPQPPPQFITIPTMDPGMMYGHPQAMYPGMPQPLPQFLPQPMGHPWTPHHHPMYYPPPPNPIPAQRPPPPPQFDTSVPHGLQGYAPLQSFPQQPAMGYPPMHPYQLPRSGMVTPYNEPRTPYNEPRSPANEPIGWADRQVYAGRYTSSPPKQQGMMQQGPQRMQPAVERARPISADSQKKVAPPMLAGRWEVRSAPQPNLREDFVMTPNGSLARIPADNRKHFAGRYDPDEAEARVRSLIADTERMLVGLSTGSGGGSPGLAV